jgi:hypothetical protein
VSRFAIEPRDTARVLTRPLDVGEAAGASALVSEPWGPARALSHLRDAGEVAV